MLKQMEAQSGNRPIRPLRDVRKLLSPFVEPLDGPLAAIFIMAGWIEDLLLDAGERPHHPRLHLSQGKEGMRVDADFPNTPCMDRLKTLLKDHKKWLRFLAETGPTYRKAIEEINKRDAFLRGVVSRHKAVTKESTPIGVRRVATDTRNPALWKFYVLRDWGSYTPLLPRLNTTHLRSEGTGGGYFLRCGSAGIVIDPGFDFIRNFYDAKCRLGMITDVIVTHDHYDHVASLGPLLNLLFVERDKRRKEIIATPGSTGRRSRLNVNFFLSRGVLDQYARAIVDFGYYGRVEPLTDQDHRMMRRHRLTQGIVLHATHTVHGDENGFGRGVGLLFNFPGSLPSLGITSDTGWFSKDGANGKEGTQDFSLAGEFIARKGAAPPEVMVLHVGSLKPDELRDSGYYKKHLGARGVFRCLSEVPSCRLALLGEFGEECCEHRSWFASTLDDYFATGESRKHSDFRCFPTDRKTYIEAEGKKLSIGRHDRPGKLLPYTHALVRQRSDGTFGFIRKPGNVLQS